MGRIADEGSRAIRGRRKLKSKGSNHVARASLHRNCRLCQSLLDLGPQYDGFRSRPELGTLPIERNALRRFCLRSGLLLQQRGPIEFGSRRGDGGQCDFRHVSFLFGRTRLQRRVLLLFTGALRLLLLRARTEPDCDHKRRNAKRDCTCRDCGQRAARHLPVVFTRSGTDRELLLLSRHVLPLDLQWRPQLGWPTLTARRFATRSFR
jgi:hypothetical protein